MKRNLIEEIRKLNDLSIAEVAEKAKIAPERLKELEELNDLTNVDVLTMLKVSKVLNTSIERLMGVCENAFVELLPKYVLLLEKIKMYERLEKMAQEDVYKCFEALAPEYVIQNHFLNSLLENDEFILNRDETAYTRISNTSEEMKFEYKTLCEYSNYKNECIRKKKNIEQCMGEDGGERYVFLADISPFAGENKK